MEEEQFIFSDCNENPLHHQSLQTSKLVEKCLNIPETIPEQINTSLDRDDLKLKVPKVMTECFSSNKENIAANSYVTSDESTVCATEPFSDSFLMRCEQKLLESSNDEEKSFELGKKPANREKLLQLSKKLKLLNETISTPPSALREQISMLRREMNEAYEFHDLEIKLLKEERQEDPESYTELIEKYSALLELYTSLKSEYENYRREQENVRSELQSKTMDCLESLCSQIETSDNSLSTSSFVSFNTDVKSSTMIGNFTEKETLLLHDATLQTKDPLSDTNIFKTPKCTPFKSAKKLFSQYSSKKYERCDPDCNVKIMEVETTLHDKVKAVEELEQRLFKIEDLSKLLQNEFERISPLLNENENLKENLINKSEELDTLTRKLLTEIISLNPDLTDSLADTPGTKLLPILIETIMERCKNMEDRMLMKFTTEKSEWEMRVNNLLEENKKLNEQISQGTAFQELKESYETKLLDAENTILMRDEEIRILKLRDSDVMRLNEDLARAKEEITRLETELSLANNPTQETEDKYHILKQMNDDVHLDLEKTKQLCETIELENNKLKERLSEVTAEKHDLQNVSEQLRRQLSEYEDFISKQKETLNLKNEEIEQLKSDLAHADEDKLKIKAELFTTESEKLNFEKRCLELENTIEALQTIIGTKDTILKELENFKSLCESDLENLREHVKEKEVIISELNSELNSVKNNYLMEAQKSKILEEEMKSQTSALSDLKESYENIQRKLLDAKNVIQAQDEEIRALKIHDSDQISEDLERAVEEVRKLKTQLSVTENCKKEMEEKYRALEQINDKLRVDLEKITQVCQTIEIDNSKLNERLSEVTKDKLDLQEKWEQLRQQLSECQDIISSREEILNLKNRDIEQLKSDLRMADEAALKVKAELFTMESEKRNFEEKCLELETMNATLKDNIYSREEEILNLKNGDIEQLKSDLKVADEATLKVKAELFTMESEKRNFEAKCLELETINANLQTTILTKDNILKDFEDFKFSRESELESMKQQIKDKEVIITDLKTELVIVKQDFLLESKKVEGLNDEVNSQTSAFLNLEQSYKDVEMKLLNAESKIQMQDEKIKILIKTHDSNLKQMEEDLEQAKKEVRRLETELSLADTNKKDIENSYHNLEQRNCFLQQDLEKAKELCESIQNEKDTILKDIEDIKSSCERELENIKEQMKEKEFLISDLKTELNKVKEDYLMEVKKVNSQTSNFTDLEESYKFIEGKLLDAENKLQIQDERIQVLLKTHDSSKKQMEEDLAQAKEEVTRLETELSLADNNKKEIEDRYRSLEQTSNNFCLDLEKTKQICQTIELENNKLKERLSEVTTEKHDLQNVSEQLGRQLTECKDVISSQEEEIQNLKNRDIEQLKSDLAQAHEVITEIQAELTALNEKVIVMEGEKEKLEMMCFELKNMNDTLQTTIVSKDNILKELENIKSSCESELENLNERLKVKETTIIKLNLELDTVKENYLMESRKAESLKEEVGSVTSALMVLKQSYKDVEMKFLDAESKIQMQDRKIHDLIQTYDSNIKQMEEDLCQAKQQVLRLDSQLLSANNSKKDIEEKHRVLVQTIDNLRQDLEKTRDLCETVQNEKDTILKDLSDIKSSCESKLETMKQEIIEKERIISGLKSELETAKKNYIFEAENLKQELNSQSSLLKELQKSYKDIERQLFNAEKKILMKDKEIRLLQSHDTNVCRTADEFVSIEGLENLKLSSVEDFPNVMKKVMVHLKKIQSRAAELEEDNEKLDEECDSYAKVIKDLKKEAAEEWKKNNEKTKVYEEKILRLTELNKELEKEKKELLEKISKLEEECRKLKANVLAEERNCGSEVDLKKVSELKRIILVKEQKLLELQDLEVQNISYKSQIEYLKNALDKERKKICEEREKNKKLQSELTEKTQNDKTDKKKIEENQVLEELRMRGSISGGVVQEIVDKEKMRKLSKDVGVLKELCRARYAEIKRLEAENASLKNSTPKNSNQMDSPIRTRGYNTRSKIQVIETWRTEVRGKENKAT